MKRRVITMINWGLGLISVLLMAAFAWNGNAALGVGLFVVWQVSFYLASSLAHKETQVRMAKLWHLADVLGYTPVEIKAFAGKYGVIDWANSRPENLQFIPSRAVVDKVIRRLRQEQSIREVEASKHK